MTSPDLSPPDTETSSRVATVLALFREHAHEWQPTTPGHPTQAAVEALRELMHSRQLRPDHLPVIHQLLLSELPPARGLHGPHRVLLDAIATVAHADSVPVLQQLYAERDARGLDGTDILEVLTRMHRVPRAVDTIVHIVASERPAGAAGLISSLAVAAEHASRCFPAWCALFDDPAYGWSSLELATGYRLAGTLPANAAAQAAAALGNRLIDAAEAWMAARQDHRATDDEMEQYTDVLRLAAIYHDQPDLLGVLDQIVDQCPGELALPVVDLLLAAGAVLDASQLGDFAAAVHLRRQCYDILARHDLHEHIPEAHRSPEAWAEVEVAEAMAAAGVPVPPNTLQSLGHAHWGRAPEGRKGTYFVFIVTHAESWQLQLGQGDLETAYIAASGPHSTSTLVTPTCDPWPPKPGTRIHWATPFDPAAPDAAWQSWIDAYTP